MTTVNGVTTHDPATAGPPARRDAGAVGAVSVLAAVLAVIVIGIAIDGSRWWAVFILTPGGLLTAVGVGVVSWPREARFVVGWLGALVLTTGLLLFTGRMQDLWPLMVMLPCLGTVALFAVRPADASLRAIIETLAGLGAVAVALGALLLALHTGLFDLDGQRWWVLFMLTAGTVPIVNGISLLVLRRGTYWFSTAVLLLTVGGLTIVAALRQSGQG